MRKLRSQYGGSDSARHERPLARPKKQKDADDEDEPTYVDEDSQDIISNVQYKALLSGESYPPGKGIETLNQEQDEPCSEPQQAQGEPPSKQQEAVSFGSSNKRKVAKVVGKEGMIEQVKPIKQEGHREKKPTKKPKKIKLSFDEQAADG